jgi:hypothetical protein
MLDSTTWFSGKVEHHTGELRVGVDGRRVDRCLGKSLEATKILIVPDYSLVGLNFPHTNYNPQEKIKCAEFYQNASQIIFFRRRNRLRPQLRMQEKKIYNLKLNGTFLIILF